jgi:hypothetical protein
MAAIKFNTAYNRVFYLQTSAGAACTGATAGMTVKISKNAATPITPTGTVSEISAGSFPGFYQLQLATADTSGVTPPWELAYSITSSTGSPATPVPLAFVDQIVNKPDPGDATGLLLTSAYDFAKGTVAIAESYAANGAAPTPIQALMAIHQMLMSFAISGTTIAVHKLDNATSAFNATIDSSTAPTTVSRS